MLIRGPFRAIILTTFSLITLLACNKAPLDNEVLEGPIEGLTSSESARFLAGDIAFSEVFTTQNGLGPLFVATSCASCHAGDGKGHPFSTLTRFGQTDSTGNHYLELGGPQLQDHAIPGYEPEKIPAGATSTKLMPPANTGLGLLEMVSDADIIAMADPNDANADGISGVAHWKDIPHYLPELPGAVSQNGKYICRFGKKAGAYSLLHQTVNAYSQDMGITTELEPIDLASGTSSDPEVSMQTVNDVVFYLRTLKDPKPRNENDADVIAGKQLFLQTGCEGCHKQTLHTGNSTTAALANKEIHPYTDLLLHDMGSGLDDGYTEGNATTAEWRTPALWGLGLAPNSQGGQYFLLHDGRATSINEAIMLHGGEAAKSKQQYEKLGESDKQELIKFLESL